VEEDRASVQSDPLDDARMPRHQGLYGPCQHRTGQAQPARYIRPFVALRLSDGGIKKQLSSKTSWQIPHFCNPQPSSVKGLNRSGSIPFYTRGSQLGSWPPQHQNLPFFMAAKYSYHHLYRNHDNALSTGSWAKRNSERSNSEN